MSLGKLRSIFKILHAVEQAEGVGARVRRSIGSGSMRNFTPFLMLDHFNVSPDAGFPDHPHRGQETVTLVMKNYMLHEDFTGSSGVLRPGDLQFMTAGQGICHSEMPYSPDGTNVEGMQLWVDLPKELKHTKPRYRDLRAEEIPIVRPNDKVQVKVISGKSYGVESVKELAYTPMDYYWFTVQPGGEFEQYMKPEYNGFLYILNGTLEIESNEKAEIVKEHHSVFFKKNGDYIKGKVPEDSESTDFVVIAGQALDQPIVQYGPFVETSKTGIHNALYDFQMHMNGFENAKGWHSEIGDGVGTQLFEQKAKSLYKDGLLTKIVKK
jgi:redox-sensitive bicupin YhaK (pirin superfamily)